MSAAEAVAAAPSPPLAQRLRRAAAEPMLILAVVFVVILLVGGLTTPSFLTLDNLVAILRVSSIVGISAVGMSTITIGGFFISLSAQECVTLAAVVFSFVVSREYSPLLAALAACLVVTIINVLQGVVVAAGLNPIIASLAVGTLIYGVVQAALQGAVVAFSSPSVDSFIQATPFGVPAPVIVFLLITTVWTVFMSLTRPGRRIRLYGANPATARLSGVNGAAVALLVFASMGVALGLAGVLAAAAVGQATGLMLPDLTMSVVAAVLVGGVSLAGGVGSPVRAAVGAVLVASIDNLMLLNQFSFGVRQIVAGALIVVSVLTVHLAQKVGK